MINTNQTPNASNLRNSIYNSTSYKFEEITLPETMEPKPFLNIIQNVINLLSNLMTKTEILSQTESSSILNNDVKTIQSLLINSSYALWMSKFIPNFKEQEHLISLLMELVNNRASLESIKLLQNSCCSYDTKFQRLSHLAIVIACTKVQQNPDTINILHNSSEFILLNLLHMLEPADITIIAQCKYLAYKSTKKLPLLKEAFMLSHYANIVDPISAETVMITIGEEIIEIYRKFPESLETNFIEFVSRRVSTSNIGAMNKSFVDFYSNLLSCNEDIKKPNKYEYLSVSNKAYTKHLLKFNETYQLKHCVRAIQNVYYESGTSKLERAYRLIRIYTATPASSPCKLDFNERIILLSNSIHNFHVEALKPREVIGSSYWDISQDHFNIDGYISAFLSFYTELIFNKADLNCTYELDFHTYFPKFLLKQVTFILYSLASNYSTEVEDSSFVLSKRECFTQMISNLNHSISVLTMEEDEKCFFCEADERFITITKFLQKN